MIKSEVQNKINEQINKSVTGVPSYKEALAHAHESKIWGTKEIDETDIGNDKIPVYKTESGKYELEPKPSGGVFSGTMDDIPDGTTYVKTENNFDDTDVSNLGTAYSHSQVSHAPSDAEKNIQADWGQVDDTKDDYIKNKPTIPVNGDFTLSGLSEKSYNNLTDKPTIPIASDVAYDATTWDSNTDVPTKNVIRDKFESLSSGGLTQAQVLIRGL